MTWHMDWPSFAFGASAGFVVLMFTLSLLRAVADVDMVPRFVVPDRPEMTDAEGAEEGAWPEAGA